MDLTKGKEIIGGLLNKLKEVFGGLRRLSFGAGFFPRSKGKSSEDESGIEESIDGIEGQDGGIQPAEGPAAPRTIFAVFAGAINTLTEKLLGHFPEKKRKPVLFGFGALAGLFLILIIAALAPNSGKTKSSAPGVSAGPGIPTGDLFLPAEPDFLPGFLLEREKRSFWSLEDIRPYWKNPEHTGLWQELLSSEVDKLMEGVP